jgi:hypothetical protein
MQPRRVPTIPPPEKRLCIIIDTDAANEVDDQHAIALALCAPDRFDLRGLVAAHFGDPALAEWEHVPVPGVDWDLRYDHAHTRGEMLRVYHIDREGTFSLLSRRLADHAAH